FDNSLKIHIGELYNAYKKFYSLNISLKKFTSFIINFYKSSGITKKTVHNLVHFIGMDLKSNQYNVRIDGIDGIEGELSLKSTSDIHYFLANHCREGKGLRGGPTKLHKQFMMIYSK